MDNITAWISTWNDSFSDVPSFPYSSFNLSFSRATPIVRLLKATPSPAVLNHPSLVLPFKQLEQVRSVYGWLWELHIYGVGALFAAVSFYALICIFQLLCAHLTRHEKVYYFILTSIILSFTSSRSVFLFLDPYGYEKLLPRFATALLLHLSLPCLISAFSMILAAVVQRTDPYTYPRRIINSCALFSVLFVNFALGISAEVLVDFLLNFPEIEALIVAAQTYFIAWSVGLSVGLWLMFSGLMESARDSDMSPKGSSRIVAALYVTLFASILLLIFAGLHVFGLIGVYGYFNKQQARQLDAWLWYGYQSALRLTEVILSALMAAIVGLCIAPHPPPVSSTPSSNQQPLLTSPQQSTSPPSPGIALRNRRDFPVTFSPEGTSKSESEVFLQRIHIGRVRLSTGRKPDSNLLERNPIHVSDDERFG